MKGKIFTAQQVQSMISGNMRMFREVVDKDNLEKIEFLAGNCDGVCETEGLIQRTIGDRLYINSSEYPEEGSYELKCPYQIGQKIFCKEWFQLDANYDDYKINAPIIDRCLPVWYKEACSKKYHMSCPGKMRAPYSMPQWASRLFPIIKEIRVERLRDISEEDAIAEGIEFHKHATLFSAQEHFAKFWNATHKKPEEKWEADPFVWCVSFEVVK